MRSSVPRPREPYDCFDAKIRSGGTSRSGAASTSQGCWLAPDGAEQVARRHSAIISRGTGRLSNSRTVRRRCISVASKRARSNICSWGISRKWRGVVTGGRRKTVEAADQEAITVHYWTRRWITIFSNILHCEAEHVYCCYGPVPRRHFRPSEGSTVDYAASDQTLRKNVWKTLIKTATRMPRQSLRLPDRFGIEAV